MTRMPWELEPDAEPFDLPWDGKDVVGWVWEVGGPGGRGETRRIAVEISGTAMATAGEYLPDETRQARETRGRSEVERVLAMEEPPRLISLGTTGRVSGERPGWSVQLVGLDGDLAYLAEEFASPEVSVEAVDGAYWLRSTDFERLGDASAVSVRAAELVGWMNGAATVGRPGFRAVEIGEPRQG